MRRHTHVGEPSVHHLCVQIKYAWTKGSKHLTIIIQHSRTIQSFDWSIIVWTINNLTLGLYTLRKLTLPNDVHQMYVPARRSCSFFSSFLVKHSNQKHNANSIGFNQIRTRPHLNVLWSMAIHVYNNNSIINRTLSIALALSQMKLILGILAWTQENFV